MDQRANRDRWPAGDGEMARRIRELDWAATPLGPIETWPQSRKSIVDMMLGSEVIMAAPWGPEGIFLYNDAYARLIGPRGATALGRPVFDALPELRELLEPQFAEVRAGRTLRVTDFLYPFARTTVIEDAWFDISYTPVRDEEGRIVAVLGFIVETTERVLSDRRREAAEAELREAEERLAMAADIGGLGHWELELATGVFTTSPLCRANFGRDPKQPFSYEELVATIHPDDRERQAKTVSTAIEARSPFEIQYRILTPGGELRWIEVRGRFESSTGRDGFTGVSIDITGRKGAEEALRESEQRLATELSGGRLLQRLSTRLIPEQSPEALYEEILDTALGLMRADAVSIQLLEDNGKRLRRVATRNLHPDSTEYWTWVDASHASTCGQALGKNERVVLEDVEAAPELTGTGDLEAFRASGTRAVQSSPLLTRTGRPIGMISTHWRAPRRFDESDFGLFDILARQVADLLERSRTEAALRESEERQAFLLELSDALRAEPNADAVAERAIRMLSEQLRLDRCYIASYRLADDRADIIHQVGNDGVPALPDMIRLSDFPAAFRQVFDQTLVIDDVAETAGLSEADRRNIEALGLRALIAPTLRMGENNPLWVIVAVSAHPRRWTRGEIALAEEVTERTWAAIERAGGETALAVSEEKYRSLFQTMGQGYADLELIRDRGGRVINYRYIALNPAYERLTGLSLTEAVGRTALESLPHLESWWLETFDRIAKRGEPERLEYQVASLNRWYEVFVYPRRADRLSVLYEDITVRKRAEEALRESEERQTFLLRFSDALRAEPKADAIVDRAVRMLAEELGLDRCYATAMYPAEDRVDVTHEFRRADIAPMPSPLRFSDFPEAGKRSFDRTLIFDDTANDPELTDTDKRALAAMSFGALLSSPVRRGAGNPIWALGAVSSQPRHWTPAEVALIQEVTERTWAAVVRARAEEALRESEERQTFLLELSDALRPLADPAEIQNTASRLLVEHVRANRAIYLEFEGDGATPSAVILSQYAREVPRFPNRIRYADFASGFPSEALQSQETIVVADTASDPRLKDDVRAAWLGTDVAAVIAVSLVKQGRVVAAFGLHQAAPRAWKPLEIRLVEEVADRTWASVERARAEAALRDSEERFRQFGDASSDVLWIRDAVNLQWEYLSPAFEIVYGVGREEALRADNLDRWTDFILEEDREHVLEQIRRVSTGERVTFEFRIRRPSDGEIRWLRDTDFPLMGNNSRVQRIGGIAQDVTDEKETSDRLQVLVGELQHRTRNLMTVVRSVVERTRREAGSFDDFGDVLRERLESLSRAQSLLSRRDSGQKVTFDELLNAELAAHIPADEAHSRVTLEGPAGIRLPSTSVQTLALAIHELTTNAVKYGALSQPEGRLAVHWQIEPSGATDVPRLSIDWRELGVVIAPAGTESPLAGGGYGRELIERALPYQLKATTTYEIGPEGVHCTISLPVATNGPENFHQT